jgi:hypothetical protein
MALRVTPVPHVSIRGAEISQMSNVVIVNGFIMINLLNMVTWFCAGLLFLFKKQKKICRLRWFNDMLVFSEFCRNWRP